MNFLSEEELLRCAHVVSIPLAQEFRGISERVVMLFDGAGGAAEWSPFREYEDREAARWLRSTLEQLTSPVEPLEHPINVNGLVPLIDATEVRNAIKTAGNPTTVKVKVGGVGTNWSKDLARVAAVRDAIGPEGKIRIDVNGSWVFDEALDALNQLQKFDIDYVEQPVSDIQEMARLRLALKETGIRVAADESIRRSGELDFLLSSSACDVAVLKVQPVGGLENSRRIVEKVVAAGLEVVVSSALESSVGLYQGFQMVKWIGDSGYPTLVAGLGTQNLLLKDVVADPLRCEDGFVQPHKPILDYAKISELEVSNGEAEWWRKRLKRCLRLLQSPE